MTYVTTHKKYLVRMLSEEMSKQINGKVSVGTIDVGVLRSFPNVSMEIKDISIVDSMFSFHHHQFFKGRKVRVSLSLTSLLKGDFQVKGINITDAQLYIFTDSSGYSNDYLMKSKQRAATAKKPGQIENTISFLKLQNVAIILVDKVKEKLYNGLANHLELKLSDQDSVIKIKTNADLLIHGIAFNTDRGSFLKEKSLKGTFTLLLNKFNKQLSGKNNKIQIAGQRFTISSRFDLEGPEPQFYLSLKSMQLFYALAKTLLPDQIAQSLSIVNVDAPINVTAVIDGPLTGGDPKINMQWSITNTNLITPFTSFNSASFTGNFTNHINDSLPRKDPNSAIAISNFSAQWNGLPVFSKHMEIDNLSEPILKADLQSTLPLESLNELLGSGAISLTSGNGSAHLTYEGPLINNNQANSLVNGEINFSDGNIVYNPRNVDLKNVNGKLIFNNSRVQVKDLRCDVLNNKILMNGNADNLLSLLNTEPGKVIINWNVYSPSLNLSSFIYLLKTRQTTSRKSSGKNKLAKIAAQIDDILDQGNINLDIKADKMSYKKFNANGFSAQLSLYPDSYRIKNVNMNVDGGNINLKGLLFNKSNNQHSANFSTTLHNIDVNKIFTSFNNFGQTGIEAKNLSGKLDANVIGSFQMNEEGKAYPNSINSTVSFSLKKGALINFEPIQKIQDFIFKRRDFTDIRFAELKNKLEIANEDIKINRMEIASSVIRVYVEGVYSLKGNTDLSIQIPFNNLKKLDSNYVPENKGVNIKAGRSLFLRGRPGADGNVDFKLDLFNKFRKQNKEKS